MYSRARPFDVAGIYDKLSHDSASAERLTTISAEPHGRCALLVGCGLSISILPQPRVSVRYTVDDARELSVTIGRRFGAERLAPAVFEPIRRQSVVRRRLAGPCFGWKDSSRPENAAKTSPLAEAGQNQHFSCTSADVTEQGSWRRLPTSSMVNYQNEVGRGPQLSRGRGANFAPESVCLPLCS